MTQPETSPELEKRPQNGETSCGLDVYPSCLLCHARQPGWFCDLPRRVLEEYDARSVHSHAKAGTLLFSEGDIPQGVSVVCRGMVRLTKMSSRGRTFLLRIAKPGDVLGLSAVLAGTPYEVTAEAMEDTEMRSFKRDEFLEFLRHHTEGSMNAASSMNREYLAAMTDASRLALSESVAGRVAHLLLELATEEGVRDALQPEIRLQLTHEEMAWMLGSSRESITRVMSEFRKKGVIAVKGDRVQILRKYTLETLS